MPAIYSKALRGKMVLSLTQGNVLSNGVKIIYFFISI